MVACLKRLLPVGLNLFAGKEQELVQHCKEKFLKVNLYNFIGINTYHFNFLTKDLLFKDRTTMIYKYMIFF